MGPEQLLWLKAHLNIFLRSQIVYGTAAAAHPAPTQADTHAFWFSSLNVTKI